MSYYKTCSCVEKTVKIGWDNELKGSYCGKCGMKYITLRQLNRACCDRHQRMTHYNSTHNTLQCHHCGNTRVGNNDAIGEHLSCDLPWHHEIRWNHARLNDAMLPRFKLGTHDKGCNQRRTRRRNSNWHRQWACFLGI